MQILDLKAVAGPSSGTTMVGDEIRDARELSVGTDDLRDIREVVEVRVDTRPGIMSSWIRNQMIFTKLCWN